MCRCKGKIDEQVIKNSCLLEEKILSIEASLGKKRLDIKSSGNKSQKKLWTKKFWQ